MKQYLVLLLALLLFLALVGCSQPTEIDTTDAQLPEPTAFPDLLIDVTPYSRISHEELVTLLGEPLASSDWSTGNGYTKIGHEYDIDGHTYIFMEVDNTVIGIHSFGVYREGQEPFNLPIDETICDYLGVTPGANMYNATSGNLYNVRLEQVSDNIATIWFTQDSLQVRFDTRVYE